MVTSSYVQWLTVAGGALVDNDSGDDHDEDGLKVMMISICSIYHKQRIEQLLGTGTTRPGKSKVDWVTHPHLLSLSN